MRVVVLAALVLVLGAGYASRIPAVADHASVEPGADVLIDVLANDGALGPDLTLLRVNGGRLGTAVVEGQQVRYTAFADAAGLDQLSYSVRRANGQVAGGRIFVTVEAPALQLTLRGSVAGVADTCELAVVVGAERFEGCVSAGTFEIVVSSTDLDSVVAIEASARPDGISESYRFASVLGSLPRLVETAAQAGTPGVLDDSQFAHLRLQEYTTMHHAQLSAEGGASVFASEASLAQAQKDFDAQRLDALAVTFHAARRGWVSLPAGVADPYAFAFDLPGFDTFYAADMPAVVEQARNDLLELAHVPMPWPAGQRIGPVLTGMGAAPGHINVPFIDGRHLMLEPAGAARVYRTLNSPDSAAVWAVDANGRVDVLEDSGSVTGSTIYLSCGDDMQPFTRLDDNRLDRVTRLIQTAHSDVVVMRLVREALNFDDIPAGCTTTQQEIVYSHITLQAFGRDQVLPIGGAATPGRWATRVPAPMPGTVAGENNAGNAGIVDFAAGTVEAPALAPTMSVAANGDNGLTLGFQASDMGFAPIDMQVFRTRTDGRGGEQWLGQADAPGIGSGGISSLSVRETHAGLFADPAQALGAWMSGFSVATEGRQSSFPDQLIFDLWAGTPGEGVRYQIIADGTLYTMPFAWEIDADQRVVMTTLYSLVTGQRVAFCEDECIVLQRRTWQPVSLDVGGAGKRLYVIEEIFQGDFEGYVSLISRRVNFYDETVAPTPVAPAPVEVVAPRARMR